MTRFLPLALVLGLVAWQPTEAGKFNKVLNVGDAAPAWQQLPGVDGQKHSLADLKDRDVVVVVFTCNSCPVARDYEDRLIAFTKKHAGPKLGLVAINVNNLPEDKLDKMTERAKERGFNFTYLFDTTQKIAKAYGANVTPEFFVLNKARKVVYMGAMDDKNSQKDVKENFLEPAVEAALSGRSLEKAETLGRGCKIKYPLERDQ